MTNLSNNSNAAIDLSSINYETIGRRTKESNLLDFFAEKVLHNTPQAIDVVKIQGMHKVVFSKLDKEVLVHRIKTNGLNVAVAKVEGPESEELLKLAPETFQTPVKKGRTKKEKVSTKLPDRSVFDAEGNVLRQAPIGTIDRAYVLQLEILANEFVQMDERANFGIHLRPAMWHGKPVHLMMTVYTAGAEHIKTASPKETKINLLGNPERLEAWLTKVQAVYDECATRLLDIPIEHESGFQFDRKAYLEGDLVVVSAAKTELTSELINTLKRLLKQ